MRTTGTDTAVLAAAVAHLTAAVTEFRQQDDLTPEQADRLCTQLTHLTDATATAVEALANSVLRFYDHGLALRDDENTDPTIRLAITVGGLYKARLALNEATSAMRAYPSNIIRVNADADRTQSVAEPSVEAPTGCRCPILPNTSRLLDLRPTVLIAPDCPLHHPDPPDPGRADLSRRASSPQIGTNITEPGFATGRHP